MSVSAATQVPVTLDSLIDKRVQHHLKSDFGRDALVDAVEGAVNDSLDQKLDAALDEKLGSVVEEKCEDLVDEKIDNIVEKKLDDVVAEKIDASVDNRLEKIVEQQVERQIGDEVSSRIDKCVEDAVENHDFGQLIKDQFDVEGMIEEEVRSHKTTEIIQQSVGEQIERATQRGVIKDAIDEELSLKMRDVSETAAALAIRMAAEARIQSIGQDELKAIVSSNVTTQITDAINSVLEAPTAQEKPK